MAQAAVQLGIALTVPDQLPGITVQAVAEHGEFVGQATRGGGQRAFGIGRARLHPSGGTMQVVQQFPVHCRYVQPRHRCDRIGCRTCATAILRRR
ncbi:MAG: hypothetical protein VX005_07150 [Pseudomonadota bacterium]|nr:hypothetical protein [Pseudomonadota bacterium]